MAAPTVSANCGAPVTVTGSLNSTVTPMASPAMNLRFASGPPCPIPDSVTPVTVGPAASAALPFTRKFAASPTAWVPRSRFASFGVAAASRIVPPFSVSAAAATEIPSASASAAATV